MIGKRTSDYCKLLCGCVLGFSEFSPKAMSCAHNKELLGSVRVLQISWPSDLLFAA